MNNTDVRRNLFIVDNELNVLVYMDSKIKSFDGEIIPTKINVWGYPIINLKGKSYLVHRLMAKHWVKNPKPDIYKLVNHIDGNKENYSIDNLEWCDHAYNNEHAINYGLRTDTVGVKAFNVVTHKTLHFPSITRCAKHFCVHTDIIAKKLNGKAKPVFKHFIIAKENEEFPTMTAGEVRDANTGFKLPLAYKKVDEIEWKICPDGFKELKEIGLSETTIRRILSKEKKDHNGYMVRKLTIKEYSECDLVRIEAVSKRSFNNVPTPIIVTDKRSGEVREYPSTKAFADELGVNPKTVQRVRLNSSDKETYKHYLIKYKV